MLHRQFQPVDSGQAPKPCCAAALSYLFRQLSLLLPTRVVEHVPKPYHVIMLRHIAHQPSEDLVAIVFAQKSRSVQIYLSPNDIAKFYLLFLIS